jgi:hypothetical protein
VPPTRGASSEEAPRGPKDLPVVDRERFAVVWRYRTCSLGNTLPFRFIELLLRRRGRCCSHVDLIEESRGGVRAASTVRYVMKRLRDRPAPAGMRGDRRDRGVGCAGCPWPHARRTPGADREMITSDEI